MRVATFTVAICVIAGLNVINAAVTQPPTSKYDVDIFQLI